MSSPAAFYDALFMGDRLTQLAQGFSRSEVHLLCYAGCLLALYDGRPSSEWEYDFVSAAGNGLPFAQLVEEGLDSAADVGLVEMRGDMSRLTQAGEEELELQKSFSSNRQRDRYLMGASDALLVFSLGNIREAFDYDPSISYLKRNNRAEWLLDGPSIDRLYSNFQELKKVLAYEAKDLSVPLVTWLKYLIHSGRSL